MAGADASDDATPGATGTRTRERATADQRARTDGGPGHRAGRRARTGSSDEHPLRGLARRLTAALPRSALGMAFLLLCMSVAAAFTGAVLYAFYEYRLGQTEDRVDAFQATFQDEIDDAIDRIGTERDQALAEVRAQLDELERFSASGETLAGLLADAEPSVWFVTTLDELGQPSVGSAFVAFSDSDHSFLIASYTTVRAATQAPAPAITVRKGDEEVPAQLERWDPANDLALLRLDRAELPALTWASGDVPTATGDRVFVVSGLGGAGGSISQGFVAGVSAQGIQHDAPVGAAFQGGPLLNSQGEVLAVASRAYAPLGFASEAVFFGVPIRNACAELIGCPTGGGQPG